MATTPPASSALDEVFGPASGAAIAPPPPEQKSPLDSVFGPPPDQALQPPTAGQIPHPYLKPTSEWLPTESRASGLSLGNLRGMNEAAPLVPLMGETALAGIGGHGLLTSPFSWLASMLSGYGSDRLAKHLGASDPLAALIGAGVGMATGHGVSRAPRSLAELVMQMAKGPAAEKAAAEEAVATALQRQMPKQVQRVLPMAKPVAPEVVSPEPTPLQRQMPTEANRVLPLPKSAVVKATPAQKIPVPPVQGSSLSRTQLPEATPEQILDFISRNSNPIFTKTAKRVLGLPDQ